VSDRGCCKPARPRRAREIAGAVVPATVLAILPKCPACIAAWLAVGTGIGISMPAAAFLRGLILVSCLGCLAFVAVRLLRRPGAGSAA